MMNKDLQGKVYTRWINSNIKERNLELQEGELLNGGLTDGWILFNLIEVLSKKSYSSPPGRGSKFRIQRLSNINSTLEFLKYEGVEVFGIDAADIIDQNPTTILELIWLIILRYQVSPKLAVVTRRTGLRELMMWLKSVGCNCNNLTHDLDDGILLCRLMDVVKPGIVEESYLHNGAPENVQYAINLAEKELGIPKLLDSEDVLQHDLHINMTYLSYFQRKYETANSPDNVKVSPRSRASYARFISTKESGFVGEELVIPISTVGVRRYQLSISVSNPKGDTQPFNLRELNSIFEVLFTPDHPGAWKVEALLSKTPITGSPVVIQIRATTPTTVVRPVPRSNTDQNAIPRLQDTISPTFKSPSSGPIDIPINLSKLKSSPHISETPGALYSRIDMSSPFPSKAQSYNPKPFPYHVFISKFPPKTEDSISSILELADQYTYYTGNTVIVPYKILDMEATISVQLTDPNGKQVKSVQQIMEKNSMQIQFFAKRQGKYKLDFLVTKGQTTKKYIETVVVHLVPNVCLGNTIDWVQGQLCSVFIVIDGIWEGSPKIHLFDSSDRQLEFTVSDKEYGKYQLVFTPDLPGTYRIEVEVESNTFLVKTNPTYFTVLPLLPRICISEGSQWIINEECVIPFTLQSPSPSSSVLSASLYDPSNEIMISELEDCGAGNFLLKFSPTSSGEYKAEFELSGGIRVNGSPLQFTITKRPSVKLIGSNIISDVDLSSPCVLLVALENVNIKEITITVTNTNGDYITTGEIYLADEPTATIFPRYNVKFVPSSGIQLVSFTDDGNPLQHSPLTIEVVPKAISLNLAQLAPTNATQAASTTRKSGRNHKITNGESKTTRSPLSPPRFEFSTAPRDDLKTPSSLSTSPKFEPKALVNERYIFQSIDSSLVDSNQIKIVVLDDTSQPIDFQTGTELNQEGFYDAWFYPTRKGQYTVSLTTNILSISKHITVIERSYRKSRRTLGGQHSPNRVSQEIEETPTASDWTGKELIRRKSKKRFFRSTGKPNSDDPPADQPTYTPKPDEPGSAMKIRTVDIYDEPKQLDESSKKLDGKRKIRRDAISSKERKKFEKEDAFEMEVLHSNLLHGTVSCTVPHSSSDIPINDIYLKFSTQEKEFIFACFKVVEGQWLFEYSLPIASDYKLEVIHKSHQSILQKTFFMKTAAPSSDHINRPGRMNYFFLGNLTDKNGKLIRNYNLSTLTVILEGPQILLFGRLVLVDTSSICNLPMIQDSMAAMVLCYPKQPGTYRIQIYENGIPLLNTNVAVEVVPEIAQQLYPKAINFNGTSVEVLLDPILNVTGERMDYSLKSLRVEILMDNEQLKEKVEYREKYLKISFQPTNMSAKFEINVFLCGQAIMTWPISFALDNGDIVYHDSSKKDFLLQLSEMTKMASTYIHNMTSIEPVPVEINGSATKTVFLYDKVRILMENVSCAAEGVLQLKNKNWYTIYGLSNIEKVNYFESVIERIITFLKSVSHPMLIYSLRNQLDLISSFDTVFSRLNDLSIEALKPIDKNVLSNQFTQLFIQVRQRVIDILSLIRTYREQLSQSELNFKLNIYSPISSIPPSLPQAVPSPLKDLPILLPPPACPPSYLLLHFVHFLQQNPVISVSIVHSPYPLPITTNDSITIIMEFYSEFLDKINQRLMDEKVINVIHLSGKIILCLKNLVLKVKNDTVENMVQEISSQIVRVLFLKLSETHINKQTKVGEEGQHRKPRRGLTDKEKHVTLNLTPHNRPNLARSTGNLGKSAINSARNPIAKKRESKEQENDFISKKTINFKEEEINLPTLVESDSAGIQDVDTKLFTLSFNKSITHLSSMLAKLKWFINTT